MEDLYIHELPFYYLGLTSPLTRCLFGIVVTSGVMIMVKPSFAFKNGEMRSWNLITKRQGGTWIPWWLPGLVVGGVFAIYI